jgi:hypothetical protein
MLFFHFPPGNVTPDGTKTMRQLLKQQKNGEKQGMEIVSNLYLQ